MSVLLQSGASPRGYQMTTPQLSHRCNSSFPSAEAAQYFSFSGVTVGAGTGRVLIRPPPHTPPNSGAGYAGSWIFLAEAQCRAAHPGAERPTGAVHERDLRVGNLHGRLGLTAQLSHRLDDLRDATAVGRVVIAQPPAVGVERQSTVRSHQGTVRDEAPALALLAEPEVLDR